jgi:hypothetical protein
MHAWTSVRVMQCLCYCMQRLSRPARARLSAHAPPCTTQVSARRGGGDSSPPTATSEVVPTAHYNVDAEEEPSEAEWARLMGDPAPVPQAQQEQQQQQAPDDTSAAWQANHARTTHLVGRGAAAACVALGALVWGRWFALQLVERARQQDEQEQGSSSSSSKGEGTGERDVSGGGLVPGEPSPASGRGAAGAARVVEDDLSDPFAPLQVGRGLGDWVVDAWYLLGICLVAAW